MDYAGVQGAPAFFAPGVGGSAQMWIPASVMVDRRLDGVVYIGDAGGLRMMCM